MDDTVLKCIMVARANLGASLAEIKDDFLNNEGTAIDATDSKLAAHLLTISGVTSRYVNGEERFFASTPQTAHIVSLVQRQRVPEKRSFLPRSSFRSCPYPTSATLARTPFAANRQFGYQARRLFDQTQTKKRPMGGRTDGFLMLRNTDSESVATKPQFSGDVREKDGALTEKPVVVVQYSGDVREKDAMMVAKSTPEVSSSGDVREKDATKSTPLGRYSDDVRARTPVAFGHYEVPFTEKDEDNNPIGKTYDYLQLLNEHVTLQARNAFLRMPRDVVVTSQTLAAGSASPNPYANSLFVARPKKPAIERPEPVEPVVARPEPKRTYKNTMLVVRKKTPTKEFRPIEPAPNVTIEKKRNYENSLWTSRPPSAYEELKNCTPSNARDPRFSLTTPPALISPPLAEQGGISTVPPPMSIKTEVIDVSDHTGAIQSYKQPEPSAVDNFLHFHRTVQVIRPNKLNQVVVTRIAEMEDPRKKVVALRSTTAVKEPMYLLKVQFGFTALEMLSEMTPDYGSWKYNSFLLQHEIIGDDFFLTVLKEDFGRICIPDEPCPKIGCCVAGQRIKDALNLVKKRKFERNVLINIGTWDLLRLSTAKEMIEIFKDLIAVLRVKEIRQPVITTLTPLANKHVPESMERELRAFNRYLREQNNCIDLHELMVDRRNHTRSSGFKHRHRYHKDDVKLVHWSQEGRKRVLAKLTAKLMVDEDEKVDQYSSISVTSSESESKSPSPRQHRNRSRSVDSHRRSHRSRTRSRSRRPRSRSRRRRTRSPSRRHRRSPSSSSSQRSQNKRARSSDHSVNIAHSTVYRMAQSPDRQSSFRYSHSTNVAYHYY